MQKLPARCKWDPETKSTFLEALKSEKSSLIFEALRQDDISPEDGISKLSSALLECADCGISPDKQHTIDRKARTSDDQPWFDKECKIIKKRINSLGKQLRQNPMDVGIRENLFFT